MIKAAQLRRFYVVYTIVFSKKRAVVKKTLRMYFPALQIGIASKKNSRLFFDMCAFLEKCRDSCASNSFAKGVITIFLRSLLKWILDDATCSCEKTFRSF